MLYWTQQQARQFLVNYQMINTKHRHSIRDIFDRLHMIQYDPLNVVGINADLVLQSRVKSHRPANLYNALYQERYLIDGWDKQMSIYLATDYSCFTRLRQERSSRGLISAKKYLDLDASPFIDEVYQLVQTKGPLYSSEITLGESKQHRWGHTKPSTVAIDHLFHQGLLGIKERKNTQKRYDLIERLIPHHITQDPFATEHDFIKWYLQRRIEVVGLAWNNSSIQFIGMFLNKKQLRIKYLDLLEEDGTITPVSIEGIKGGFYVPTEALDIPINLSDSIQFIAPLDSLIWDRTLLRELFQFDYTWEVYTPKAKRKYGYYVLPILRQSKLIGRIEFKTHRGKSPLEIRSCVMETGVKQTNILRHKLDQALNRFARYLGASDILPFQIHYK